MRHVDSLVIILGFEFPCIGHWGLELMAMRPNGYAVALRTVLLPTGYEQLLLSPTPASPAAAASSHLRSPNGCYDIHLRYWLR